MSEPILNGIDKCSESATGPSKKKRLRRGDRERESVSDDKLNHAHRNNTLTILSIPAHGKWNNTTPSLTPPDSPNCERNENNTGTSGALTERGGGKRMERMETREIGDRRIPKTARTELSTRRRKNKQSNSGGKTVENRKRPKSVVLPSSPHRETNNKREEMIDENKEKDINSE